jgi:hypothetical protein
MKQFTFVMLSIVMLAVPGCSRSDKPATSVKPPANPDAERLKSDSERLQQATANAARERERANQTTPIPSVSPYR